MTKMKFSFILIAAVLLVSACGEKGAGGAAGGKWVGEVYPSIGSSDATVIGEFDSYEECLTATMEKAKSGGSFNCGVK